jgi:hypothetical protein
MKNHIIPFLLLALLVSCGDKSKVATIPADLKYTILEEKKNEALNKDNVKVELSRNVSKEELTIIANELRESRTQYEKLWIAYYLKGTPTPNVAYAVSNFTPELSVSFNGATQGEKEKFASAADSIDGTIIGKWREEPYTASTFIFFEKNGKYFVRQIIKDGIMPDDQLKKSKMGKLDKYQQKSDSHGEYFVIGENGELLFYSKDGKYTTGTKM